MKDFEKIKELVELMKEYDLNQIELKDGDNEIKLRKGFTGSENLSIPNMNPLLFGGMNQAANTLPGQAQDNAADASAPARDPNIIEFKSPMVGTFYRAPSPESPPYVTEGDRITKDTVLCIIEAMKVMNEIKAEASGEVVEILLENGEAVEFGQPLYLVRRSG